MAKILIVEDSESMRHVLESALDDHDIVGYAKNGQEAVDLYKKLSEQGSRPDIVTMDIVMPKKNGLSAINEIKEYDPDANILAITALTKPSIIKEFVDSGAQYLDKPFDVKKLLEMIDKMLNKK
ncbi:MAG: response regulator [Methanosarcinales archaeon]